MSRRASALPRGRVTAVAAVSALSIAATATASSVSPQLYAVGPTKACLESVPHAINGLPPATPPSSAARFVSELTRYRFWRSASGQVGVWEGRERGEYAGAIVTFFKSAPSARVYFEDQLIESSRIRNVVVEWGFGKASRRKGWRAAVLGCLRTASSAAGTPPPKRSTPRATFATFAGHWGGHTRRLQITPSGRAVEIVDSGCCVRVYRSTFQILSVSGTLTRATATYRVISSTRSQEYAPRFRTGQVGKLRLRNGIVTNTLSKVFFCSAPAWWATGACGA